MNPKWARIFLRIAQGLFVACAILFGAIVASTSSAGVPEKVFSGIFLGGVWAALHVGYLLAPRFFGTPRRKWALWLMAVPALVCLVTILFSLNALLNDVAVNPQNRGLIPLMLGYVAAGAALYLGPFFIVLFAKDEA